MSCFGCNKKYGLFTKEYGCPNCGYSYCAKCLKRPVPVPRHGGKVANVCLICYDKLSKLQAQASEKVIDCEALPGTLLTKPLVKDLKKGDENSNIDSIAIWDNNPPLELGEVLQPKPTVSTNTNTDNSEFDENLDTVISKRLKNLKTVENLPSNEEISARLANLNDMPHKNYSKKDILLSTDQRTDQQKMQDLVEQFMGEVQIDERIETERYDAISDIERRLRALRDTPIDNAGVVLEKAASPDTNTPSDNEQDDETVLKNIMEKYLAEARLPRKPTDLETELESSIPLALDNAGAADTEELPWCNICNEDAVLRCKGCDGELFCAACFRDCHDDDEEYRTHVKETYTAPPKFKEDHF